MSLLERSTSEQGKQPEIRIDRPPREELWAALEAVGEVYGEDVSKLTALDIGAGGLVESEALLAVGFGEVIATDTSQVAQQRELALGLRFNDFAHDHERFRLEPVRHEDLAPRLKPESTALIISYDSLSFTHPGEFDALWHAMVASLEPGGVLSVNLYGEHDSLAGTLPMTFVSAEQVDGLLAGLEVISCDETERDDPPRDGRPQHRHSFSVLARKPRSTPENQV